MCGYRICNNVGERAGQREEGDNVNANEGLVNGVHFPFSLSVMRKRGRCVCVRVFELCSRPN